MAGKEVIELKVIAPLIERQFLSAWLETERCVSDYTKIPQLTCGQFGPRVATDLFAKGLEKMNTALKAGTRAQIDFLLASHFCQEFFDFFAEEIRDFELMKSRLGTSDLETIRNAYLDENGFDWNHPARWSNFVYK